MLCTTNMYKPLTIFVITLFALSRASVLQPRDVVDEAKKQLEQLKSIVEGDIFAAHDELENLVYEMKMHVVGVTSVVDISISKHHYYAIQTALGTLVNLATEAGYDVTSCTDTREELLNSLPNQCRQKVNECMRYLDGEGSKAAQDAKYTIDVYMNKVHNLENQLRRCREDASCITPVMTEIELEKIRVPEKIKTEVLVTESFLSTLSVSIQNCADSNVAEYTAESLNILEEIETCINDIMG